nr:hypothetical protein [Bacteroidales bacterium]
KWTDWGGSQIVFNIHGTSKLIINAHVIDPDTLNECRLIIKLDNSPDQYNSIPFTSLNDIYTGNRSISIMLGYFGLMVPPFSVKQCHFERCYNNTKI